ncbi:hypothetical protein KUDE01_031663 [Dissostichus eleginoides]|uniref:Uncharacterized protein n=1 Tax=Dissostichus eleginoides TaxID=100907 RepID=A0AAD9F159_DISEL|nr:hypothetical protein KUDE01_031663 [Dissostichus eleginoides]
MICTQCAGPEQQCSPPCVHALQYPDDLLQHFHTRSSAVQWEVSSASPSQLGWVSSTEVQAEGRGPLLCVHNTLNATHCTVALNRWGVVMGEG